ncbi:hypothetical protein MHM83_11075 [Tenacibaculum sp. Mcav3-52]|uniref:hypothetical protein n=1 Tax=Tenacibaculum sp. Mcav3-52 TaxID=2917762 RepID=UPI001EF26433|nr:hypothetical protein [Tenacibaculum sp. Mcav3-52]MCG7502415.1 hypothetical protein [Tenacibaculum sp. Mcav3-52]
MEKITLLDQVVLNSRLVPVENHRKVVAYLAVVLLKARFADLSCYFGRSEKEVRKVVTVYAVKLSKNTSFASVLFELTKRFYVSELINEVV